MSGEQLRRCSAVFVYLSALVGVGAVADIIPCGTGSCIRIRPSDEPLTTLGPFEFGQGAFAPPDKFYTTKQLAQNYAALYYAQYLIWRDLQSNTPGPPSNCPEDVDGDGIIGMSDLSAVLGRWGQSCSLPATMADVPIGQ